MTSLTEISVNDLAANLKLIDAIELGGKKVKFFINGKNHDVDYGSDPAALVAYQEWLAILNTPQGLQVGDHVRMRQPQQAREAANVTYTIQAMPLQVNNGPTWWEMLGDQDGLTYIFSMLVVFTIEP